GHPFFVKSMTTTRSAVKPMTPRFVMTCAAAPSMHMHASSSRWGRERLADAQKLARAAPEQAREPPLPQRLARTRRLAFQRLLRPRNDIGPDGPAPEDRITHRHISSRIDAPLRGQRDGARPRASPAPPALEVSAAEGEAPLDRPSLEERRHVDDAVADLDPS